MGGTPPERPDWIASYIAGTDGETLPDGRKLKGEVYTGTYLDPAEAMNALDYLLAFPNPARETLHLRFVLNRESDIRAEAFDLSGRRVQNLYIGTLMPAEHDLPINVSAWEQGMYLIRVHAGEEIIVRKVTVF